MKNMQDKYSEYDPRSGVYYTVDVAQEFFLDNKNKVIFNEINTVPGFTGISLFAKAWEASGVPFTDVLDILIEIAMR